MKLMIRSAQPLRIPHSASRVPLALYLHIPFCDHRCTYCDFNAYAGLDSLMPAYTDALVGEIVAWGAELGVRQVGTVFFGGGTPSLMPLPLLRRVTEAIRACFSVAPDAEWSLEANPGTVDEAYFRGLRSLGVNRVSIGVQSFDDGELRQLDRIHNGATAEAAYRAARAAGFDNINLDLIFGLEGQTLGGWERNLRRAAALGPEHLSLYALTIEEGTPLAHRVSKGLAPEPDADLQAEMYELAEELLGAAGYEHYEISNWARPGYACRHNLVYWRDGDWLGMGAGAHSHLGGVRFAVVKSPAAYVRRVQTYPLTPSLKGGGTDEFGPNPVPSPPLPFREGGVTGGAKPRPGRDRSARFPWIASCEEPDSATAMADTAILALRLTEGLSLSGFQERFGVAFDAVYGHVLGELVPLGLIERDGDRLRITRRGRLLSNEVFARLMPV